MSTDILDTLAEAIHQRHGSRVVALDMSRVPLTMEAFLIATAENRIQARAIADHVEETARMNGFVKHHIEGYEEGSWILLDLLDLVVHIFLPETREYYSLEMLWSDAPSIVYEDDREPGDDEPGPASD
ncbi:MAG: ribosome silencing factor [Candidatus Fermentibacteraceae bacterium]|nr:ribosome silencing factor [Candidatus Fermentibacteraceae bacterium]MBN2608025.1 ribosome silencing factor [Candidatus Fermentibacteraceae bacterium]